MDDANNNPPRATLADRENREFGIEPLDAATPAQFAALGRRRAIAAALLENATVPRRCKACGGGSVYLAAHPLHEYCTPECAERGPSKARVIASALDIDLSGVPMGGIPTLPEDRAASEMMDGPEPPCAHCHGSGCLACTDPEAGIAELIVERDEAIAALDRVLDELHRVRVEFHFLRAENEALRKQLSDATDRARAYVRDITGGK